MTVAQYLNAAAKKLVKAEIDTARLDSLILLEDVTGIDRARLLAEPGTKLSAGQMAQLEKLLIRRARHEPLAYVRGQTEFYGREFVITPAVLQPRPETETMIELLKSLYEEAFSAAKKSKMTWSPRIADVGAGSGALGITAALELPTAKVDLLEIDDDTLSVAKSNIDKFTLDIPIIKSDLLAQAPHAYDILLCNLPYIPDDYPVNAAAQHEPRRAIFGGADGLDLYRRLFTQIAALSNQPLYILTEALPVQHNTLQSVAEQAGYQQHKADDFIQLFGLK